MDEVLEGLLRRMLTDSVGRPRLMRASDIESLSASALERLQQGGCVAIAHPSSIDITAEELAAIERLFPVGTTETGTD